MLQILQKRIDTTISKNCELKTIKSHILTICSAVGGSIVLAGVLVTGLRKWLKTMPETSSAKKRFAFLLR
jgi:hypothetical protein